MTKQKKSAAAPTTNTRAKALPDKGRAAAQAAEAQAEAEKAAKAAALKEKWRQHYAQKRAEKRAEKRAAAAKVTPADSVPAPAPAAPAPVESVVQLTKTELIGALKAALLNSTDETQRLGLRYALELARRLEG